MWIIRLLDLVAGAVARRQQLRRRRLGRPAADDWGDPGHAADEEGRGAQARESALLRLLAPS